MARFEKVEWQDDIPGVQNGTLINKARLDQMQTQYKLVAGIQTLDTLPAMPDEGHNICIVDNTLYVWYGNRWVSFSSSESFDLRGSVPSFGDLPSGAQDGDAYVTLDTGHLWMWNGSEWIDLGLLIDISGLERTEYKVPVMTASNEAQYPTAMSVMEEVERLDDKNEMQDEVMSVLDETLTTQLADIQSRIPRNIADRIVTDAWTTGTDVSVTLVLGVVDPSNGNTSIVTVPLPIASESEAGMASAGQISQMNLNSADIQSLKGRAALYAVNLTTDAPTQQDLDDAYNAIVPAPPVPPRDATTLLDLTYNKEYTWLESSSQWVDRGTATVSKATNASLGIVKGNPSGDGVVYVEDDGSMTVLGWDAINASLSNHVSNEMIHLGTGSIDTSFPTSPSDEKVPSTKLIKDTLEGKANLTNGAMSDPISTPMMSLADALSKVQVNTTIRYVAVNSELGNPFPELGADQMISGRLTMLSANYLENEISTVADDGRVLHASIYRVSGAWGSSWTRPKGWLTVWEGSLSNGASATPAQLGMDGAGIYRIWEAPHGNPEGSRNSVTGYINVNTTYTSNIAISSMSYIYQYDIPGFASRTFSLSFDGTLFRVHSIDTNTGNPSINNMVKIEKEVYI